MKIGDIFESIADWAMTHPGAVIVLLAFFAGAVVGKLL